MTSSVAVPPVRTPVTKSESLNVNAPAWAKGCGRCCGRWLTTREAAPGVTSWTTLGPPPKTRSRPFTGTPAARCTGMGNRPDWFTDPRVEAFAREVVGGVDCDGAGAE